MLSKVRLTVLVPAPLEPVTAMMGCLRDISVAPGRPKPLERPSGAASGASWGPVQFEDACTNSERVRKSCQLTFSLGSA